MFEDRGGILTFVGGLVALTIIATGLAVVMEKRAERAKVTKEAAASVAENTRKLENIVEELERAQESLGRLSGRKALDAKYVKTKASVEKGRAKLEELRGKHSGLQQVTESLDGEYSDYRKRYVSGVRAKAEGEEIEKLQLITGREYSNVTINRVTEDGMEIRHEFGSARISSSDLDGKWSERFQWN